MKILIITKTLVPRSGWGRYSAGAVDALSARGIEVAVMSEDQTTDSRFKLYSGSSIFNLIRNAFRARRLAKKYDLIHAFDGWPYGFYGYAAVIGAKKPLFINAVGTYSIAVLYRRGLKYLMTKVYQRADRLFCISDFIRQKIMIVLPTARLATVYLGLTPLPPLMADELNIFKQKYDLVNGQPLILTVGEIKNRKGQLLTLKAVAELKKKYPDILYAVVGSVGSAGYVEAMKSFAAEHDINNNLKFFSGISDDRDLAGFYQSATVFALNAVNNERDYHYEGFGLVLLEAASFGLPVVGSENSGTAEALADGQNGYLTKQNDPFDIAEKIEKILSGDQVAMSQKGREFAKKFTWQKTAEEYEKRYIKVLKTIG